MNKCKHGNNPVTCAVRPFSTPCSDSEHDIMREIIEEILRGNEKHGHGPLATEVQVIAILCEELGEYSQAILQNKVIDARKELIQIAAVAINHLSKTGPHFSSK